MSFLPFDVLIVLNLFSYDYNNEVFFLMSPTGLGVIYYNVVSLPVQSIFTIIKPIYRKNTVYFIYIIHKLTYAMKRL